MSFCTCNPHDLPACTCFLQHNELDADDDLDLLTEAVYDPCTAQHTGRTCQLPGDHGHGHFNTTTGWWT